MTYEEANATHEREEMKSSLDVGCFVFDCDGALPGQAGAV